ncbi:MAG: hypothetical protein WDO06_01485 [Actinomycetota bacterium]
MLLPLTTVAGAPAAHADKVALNITTWMGSEPGRKEAWEATLAKFNAQSQTSEVKLSGWPFAQYVNQVLTGLEAGSLTDDLIMSTHQILLFDFLRADISCHSLSQLRQQELRLTQRSMLTSPIALDLNMA